MRKISVKSKKGSLGSGPLYGPSGSKRSSGATGLARNSAAKLERISPTKGKIGQSPDLRGAHNAVLPGIRKKGIQPQKKNKTIVAIFDEILEGNLENLPPKPPSEVRVFLSSTFSDMRTERNWLAKEAYPKLKDYCYNVLNIDFSVVDMRWGVTDDAVNEHITEDLCLKEIANCQRVGLGPHFVTLLGDRYGFRPIPSVIPEEEFLIICKECVICEKSKMELLKVWYVRDDNAVPPRYVLQPVSSLIPAFGDHSNESGAKQAKEQWQSVMATLTEMLRLAVDSATKKGLMTADRRHDYYKSVTEQEIDKGLYQAVNPNAHCLGFIRRFTGLDNHAVKEHLDSAQRYIDVKTSYGNKAIDFEVEELRNHLQRDKIPAYLSKERLCQYQLPWQPEGVKPEKYEEHFDFARNFCGDFINGILTLISNEKDRLDNQIPVSEYYTDYNELLHHLHFSQKKSENFKGQSDVLQSVQKYLLNFKNRAPLIIHAESGCGKTSMMAKIFESIPMWFSKQDIRVTRIIRFLGTSPWSSNIYNVLRGVAGQVADNYEQIMEPDGYKTMKGIVKYLPRFLRNVSRVTRDHIFILLDSVDQMSPNNKAYDMRWLPTDLPSNVHLIISMLPNYCDIFQNTKKLRLPSDSFIQVTPLKEETSREIINAALKTKQRILTAKQEALILHSLQKLPNPLYLKLLLDRAVKWKSSTEMEGIEIASSVRGAINHLFTNLEQRFGKVLISHTLGYITVGLNGLTEVELEDALSCDDEVLDEVYQYHNPPVEGIVRIPPMLWARVRNEITEYLTERSSQQKTTLYWYHRQFIEAAEDRYAQNERGRKLHANLAELYQCERGMFKDITLSRRKLTIPDADRQITAHPLVVSNVRALMTLPYHLRKSEDLNMLKVVTLCNLNFLMTKIKSLGMEAMFQDFTDVMVPDDVTRNITVDADISIVQNCLWEMMRQNKKWNNLASEILARIPDDDYWLPYATMLVRECRLFLQEEGKPNVIPLYPCLYDKGVLMECMSGISSVLQHHGDTLLVECLVKLDKGLSACKALDLKETSTRTMFELSEGLLYKMMCDSNHIYAIQETNLLPKTEKGDDLSEVQVVVNEYDMSKKDNEKLSQIQHKVVFSSSLPMIDDDDFTVKCFDIFTSNHSFMMLSCHGKTDVLVYDLKKDEAVNQYKVITKRINSASTNQILVQGDEPQFLFCSFALHGVKTVIVIQSSDGESQWTTLNVNTVAKPAHQTIQIPGSPLNNKWSLHNDEKYFVLPVIDLNDTTRITLFDLAHGKHQSLKLSSTVVKDISVSCIGNLTCYVLTETGIEVYDLLSQSELLSINCFDSGMYQLSPCCITVEDDAQHAYVGHTDGTVMVWKVDQWEHLGHVNFECGGKVKQIYLNNSENNVAVHGDNCSLFTVEQKQLIEQCKRNLQILKTARRDNQKDLVTLKTASLLLFSHSDIQAELITCEMGNFQYWDLGSMEYEKSIGYGKSFENFKPNKVAYNNEGSSRKCLLYDKQHAVIIDVNKAEVDFKILVPGNGVIAAASCNEGFFIVTRTNDKVEVNLIDARSGDISKTIKVKDTMKSEDIEVKVTANGKYLVFKVQCSDKEWEIIKNSEKKGGNMKISLGKHKLYGLDLQKATGELIPCYRQLTKITCLVDSFETWKDSMVLIGRMRKVVVWDVSTSSNDSKLVKGTRIPMFFRPHWVEDFDDDWYEVCHGKLNCMQYAGPEGCKVLATGSVDGWLFIFGEDGRSICENPGKKPNNSSPVEHVCVAPNALWVASVNTSHILKCWSVADQGQEIFSIKLNVKVKQLTFDPSGEYLGVLGERNDGSTKVLLFHMFKKKK